LEIQIHECRYDFGGYFIVNGNEKVLIMQDRINENETLVFVPNNNNDGVYAEIRSMSDSSYLPPKTTSINMVGKLNHMGRNIRLNTSFLKSEVPVFIMFRALGIISDREIMEHVVYDMDNKDNQRIINQLMACCEDACDIHTQEQAEEYLIKNMTGVNKNTINPIKILRDNIINDFLGHVGKNYRRKALYLGYMCNKMLRIYLKYDDYDNRDSYMNKRIDTPGVLMSNLFRQCYGKMTKEIKGLIERELNLWRANHTCLTTDIISDNNIHRYFKHSLLDSWLKYSLSTGNWGIKSIGSFQNIRQGVSQVLNRMSYTSTLSHLRRISTAMEKNGKLVQPRKLDNSQINMICPAETPEGASVGLVKNIALSTNISIAMNSTHIRTILIDLGTNVYDDSYSYLNDNIENIKIGRNKTSNFLKEMGNPSNVYIQINGDIIGYHTNPIELYKTLKHYKRCGIIYPMTSIIWNILKKAIIISTEAGRMYRPLLIVDYDNNTKKPELRIIKVLREKGITWNEFIKDKTFDNLICPNNKENEEGIIEYLDCNEINHAMIAMNYHQIYKSPKGNTMPVQYTNCEIHPSLMNGVLGVNIPFSDHNQSPRNCYQCLNENEKVLLSNGDYKLIKDIIIGDKVICFNPISMETSIASVINHYNRITNKIVYNIKLISGRSITATYDHKFMTNQGWIEVKDFDETIKIGILMTVDYYDNENINNINNNPIMIKININDKINEFYKSLGLYPLLNNNYNMPIISRICGYYYKNKFNFNNEINKKLFIKDCINIGFINNIFDITLEIFIKSILDDIHNWLYKSSTLIKKEFLSGYLSYNNNNNYSSFIKDLINEININNIRLCYNYDNLKRYSIEYEYSKYKLERYRSDIILPEYSLDEFENLIEIKENMMFIPFSSKFINNNNYISDLTIDNTEYHSFIGGNGFAVSNCAMGKQALGIYMSNFNHRTDTMGNIINYPQRSIVATRLSKYTYNTKLPSGANAIVAIMTHTGFNQEDSVMINKSALDRGLFTSTYYKVFRDQCTKNHSSGEEEIFINPKDLCSGKPYSYSKLGDDGFIPKNTYVDNGDIIVGKVMPRKMSGKNTYQDNSIYMKSNDDGYIDMNYVGTNSEGYKFCKIRIRKNRKPEIGDKLACYSPDHEYLTSDGWIFVNELTLNHKVASLVDGKLIYQYPKELHEYDYNGKMYNVKNNNIDLLITPNHRMYYKSNNKYEIKKAEDIYHTSYKLKKNVDEWNPNYSEEIPKCLILNEDKTKIIKFKNYENNNIINIDDYLINYGKTIDSNKTLDNWVWYLNKEQSNLLLKTICLPDKYGIWKYYTSSNKFGDDIQKLSLHSGYSCNKQKYNNYWILTINISYNEPNINKNNDFEDNYIDYNGKVYCCSLEKGDGILYIRRNGKVLWCGNSTSAQKGSVGMIYDHKDMPFTKDGIVPDIIINPHAIPSRMTMAQLMECIMGKVGCFIGAYGDATPFSGCTVEDIAKNLEKTGLERYGNEIMYNGRTGEQIKTEIFIGPTYYQRLKHMVTDKIHSRGSNGPIVMLTRQCSEGRARGGGLRLGEMERDCFIGHGSALFLKEKMLDCADNYRVFICKDCGMIATVNPEKNIYKCNYCKNATDIIQIRIPYAFKLLTQELNTMNVIMRYICN